MSDVPTPAVLSAEMWPPRISALRRLMADIEAGRVDVVVVYKIDRLSRALMDFARLVEESGDDSDGGPLS